MMLPKHKLLFATLLCSFTVAVTGVAVDPIRTQYMKSMQTLMSARSSERHVEVGDQACFLWYFGAVEYDIDTFSRNSDSCNYTEYSSIKLLNWHGTVTRDDFVRLKDNICNEYAWCERIADLLQFYSCYKSASANSVPEIYNLFTNTTADYNILFGQYHSVYDHRKQCDEHVRLIYIRDSEETNKRFQDCRDGKGVPTKSTQTTLGDFNGGTENCLESDESTIDYSASSTDDY